MWWVPTSIVPVMRLGNDVGWVEKCKLETTFSTSFVARGHNLNFFTFCANTLNNFSSGFTFCRLMPALVKFQWRFLSFARFDCTSQKRTLHKAKSESLVNKSMSFAILITIGLIFSIGSTQIYCQVKKLSVPLPEM